MLKDSRLNFMARNRDMLAILIIFAITFALYFNSFKVPFVFDDEHMIVGNSLIKSIGKLPSLFTSGDITSVPIAKGMYRPILMLSFAFNYFFGRLNPLGYHIINIMLHFLNATMLFLLLRFLLRKGSFWPAFLSSLLFVAHPVNSEAVIYISCRSTLMFSFFFLVGVFVYTRDNLGTYDNKYLLVCLAFILGLLTKETMIVFPLVLMGYDLLFRRDIIRGFRGFLKLYLPLILISIFYLALRQYFMGAIGSVKLSRSIYQNILTQSVVSIFYLKIFFLPFNLCIGRFFHISKSFFEPAVVQSTLTILALASLAISSCKKFPLFSFAILWYFLNLLPKFIATLNLMAVEHQLYLPAVGIFMVLAIIFKEGFLLVRNNAPYLKVTAMLIFISILSIYSYLTVERNFVWRSEYNLWINNLKCSPRALPAYNNLGIISANEGRVDEAQGYFVRALEDLKSAPVPLDDLEIMIHINLANIYIFRNDLNLAEEELTKALAINPNVSDIHNNLGLVYLKQKLRDKAIKEFQFALELEPDSELAHLNLGISYWEDKKAGLAIKALREAIRINPDNYKPYIALVQIYDTLGNYAQAAYFKEIAIKLVQSDSQDYYNLGILYGKIGDRRALAAFKKALDLEPGFAPAHYNLAVTYANLNPPQLELAKKHALLALKYGYKVRPEFLRQLGIEK